jgi:hypothetical protein
MYSSSNTKPRWWQLYLTFPLLIALFILDGRFRISTRGHQAVQIGVVLLVYGLVHLWLKANRRALLSSARQKTITIYKVIELPPPEPPGFGSGSRSMLQIPNSEIHGLLGDSTDLRGADVELLSNSEIHKN